LQAASQVSQINFINVWTNRLEIDEFLPEKSAINIFEQVILGH